MRLPSVTLLSAGALDTISRGGVHVQPDWIPPELLRSMRDDARGLFERGLFSPDGLTNTAKSRAEQGFDGRADRQTYKGDGWDADVGDAVTRRAFAERMRRLRVELAAGLGRPSLAPEGPLPRHETTYNWYEPGARLGRHLDEHHEETKGPKGWTRPTRRSVTWLVYLNDAWRPAEGGALRTFPRRERATHPVGSHEGDLQVGWLSGTHPVFLDAWRPSGGTGLYAVEAGTRLALSGADFDVPRQPIDFAPFLLPGLAADFEQISTARLDPRFAAAGLQAAAAAAGASPAGARADEAVHHLDVPPVGGTLVLFDSVSLPHCVEEVTASRQRIAATGWFHEESRALA